MLAGALALALALADPAHEQAPRAAGGPVVLVLDASGSMLVEDVGEPRLELQRRTARELTERLAGTPVGLVAFAGRAFSLTPPTRDPGSLEMYLAALDPTVVTQSGSSLEAAIRQGIALVEGVGTGRGGTLVLLSDGEETTDRAAAGAAAALARRRGTTVHVVGVGSVAGGPVPALDLATGRADGYLLDQTGEPLVSRLDPDLLGSLAQRTGGIYLSASEAGAAEQVVAAILDGGPELTRVAPPGVPRFVWLAGLALLLLLVEPIAGGRPGRGG